MHNARISTSPRLRRALEALRAAPKGLTTWELGRRARTVAVSTTVSELRANGCQIDCRQETGPSGQKVWVYTLRSEPKGTSDA